MATLNKTITSPRTSNYLPASGLERALYFAAARIRAARLRDAAAGEASALPPVDLEALADVVIEAAIRDTHAMVLCSAQDAGKPTAQETGWAQSLAGAVATRFQRTARKVLRSLKQNGPAVVIDDTPDDNGCPAWCVRHGSAVACDWCESRPIAFQGPGDFYAEKPEPFESLWAVISEAPMDEVAEGADPTPYIFFDTLGDGMGDRLDVAKTDAVIKQLTRYVSGLQVLRDQLAELVDHA